MKKLAVVMIAVLLASLASLAVVPALTTKAEAAPGSSLAGTIINRTDARISRSFDRAFGSPSRAQYGRPAPRPVAGSVPPQASRALCRSVVQNRNVPRAVQVKIKRAFGLACKPAGSRFPF